MTALELKDYLDVLRVTHTMQIRLKTADFELDWVSGPEPLPTDDTDTVKPGGWKQDTQDPQDPDPLGLGNLDAEFEDELPSEEPKVVA